MITGPKDNDDDEVYTPSRRERLAGWLAKSRVAKVVRRVIPEGLGRRMLRLARGGRLEDGQIVGVKIGNMLLYVPNDEYWRTHIHNLAGYEPEIRQLIDKFAQQGNTLFIDCGANIGLWSSYAADKIGDPERVLAIEPGSETRPVLEMNQQEHDYTIITKAISDSVCAEAPFYKGSTHAGNSLKPQQDEQSSSETVSTETLDRLIAEHGKGLNNIIIKLDVEGVETEAMQGMRETLKNQRNIIVMYEDHGKDKNHGATRHMLAEGLHVYRVNPNMNTHQIQDVSALNALKQNHWEGYNFVATIPGTEFDREMQHLCNRRVDAAHGTPGGEQDKPGETVQNPSINGNTAAARNQALS